MERGDLPSVVVESPQPCPKGRKLRGSRGTKERAQKRGGPNRSSAIRKAGRIEKSSEDIHRIKEEGRGRQMARPASPLVLHHSRTYGE